MCMCVWGGGGGKTKITAQCVTLDCYRARFKSLRVRLGPSLSHMPYKPDIRYSLCCGICTEVIMEDLVFD